MVWVDCRTPEARREPNARSDHGPLASFSERLPFRRETTAHRPHAIECLHLGFFPAGPVRFCVGLALNSLCPTPQDTIVMARPVNISSQTFQFTQRETRGVPWKYLEGAPMWRWPLIRPSASFLHALQVFTGRLGWAQVGGRKDCCPRKRNIAYRSKPFVFRDPLGWASMPRSSLPMMRPVLPEVIQRLCWYQ